MTYGVGVVIKPGPRLNLVLGPNGTGKSSLVCALCVCLGGSLKLLGRADNLRDFIRRGTDSCAVEVTLSGGPGSPDLRVRRTLEASTTTTGGETTEKVVSKFYMHDSLVKQADVLAAMQIMGVQLDNLCQFLPQDKVVEFARLDARQLLAATERAVGTGRLHEQHEQLTEKAAQLNELTVVGFCADGWLAGLRGGSLVGAKSGLPCSFPFLFRSAAFWSDPTKRRRRRPRRRLPRQPAHLSPPPLRTRRPPAFTNPNSQQTTKTDNTTQQ